jgi:hypothetical protein
MRAMSALLATAVICTLPSAAVGGPMVTGGGPSTRSDFNGDGVDDLAIAAIQEDVGTVEDAGAVTVLYGTSGGLTASGSQFWHQDNIPSPDDGAETFDVFGDSLASGDFDADGFFDLAVGVPNEELGGDGDAGALHILYGSLNGLTTSGSQYWTQGALGHPEDGTEPGDRFGDALAAGNFGNGPQDDLAVGATGEDVGAISNAGAVNIIYGSSVGLAMDDAQWLHQNTPGMFGDGAEASDFFPGRLAVGDFGQGPQADLALTVIGEDVDAIENAGAVNILFGSSAGVTTQNSQFWHQDRPGVAGNGADAQDNFGVSLAAANFGKGSRIDLAIGVRIEDVGGVMDAGAVNVLYGSADGLTTNGDQFWHQNKQGMAGDGTEEMDLFGWSSAAGDFGKTSHADLAVGVINEDVGAIEDAGAVNVLYGSADGLTTSGDQFWHQNKPGMAGDGAEADDWFSFGDLAADNFGKGSRTDLGVGVSIESVGGAAFTGAVNVLYGGPTGLTTTGDQFWHQDSTDVAGDGGEEGDQFGFTLAG